MVPGRGCPLHYRYASGAFGVDPDLVAETIYVAGGLYGNAVALDALLQLVAADPGPATLVFNGDFNWFNVDAVSFRAVNEVVLRHRSLRGNVETELAHDDDAAGCGCAYPDWVGDAEVERSNQIMARLRQTARAFPEQRALLAALPMQLIANVNGTRIAIVHGDLDSLAGWDLSQERLANPGHRARIAAMLANNRIDIIASSHTCLPVLAALSAASAPVVVINNGAAGMPNFHGTRFGVVSRISVRPARHVEPLYALRSGGTHVEALPLYFDVDRWLRAFAANWPEGSPARQSYLDRMLHGPRYAVAAALRDYRESIRSIEEKRR